MRTSPFPQAKGLSSLHDKVSLLLTILQKPLYVKCSQAFPWPRRGPGRDPGPFGSTLARHHQAVDQQAGAAEAGPGGQGKLQIRPDPFHPLEQA